MTTTISTDRAFWLFVKYKKKTETNIEFNDNVYLNQACHVAEEEVSHTSHCFVVAKSDQFDGYFCGKWVVAIIYVVVCVFVFTFVFANIVVFVFVFEK